MNNEKLLNIDKIEDYNLSYYYKTLTLGEKKELAKITNNDKVFYLSYCNKLIYQLICNQNLTEEYILLIESNYKNYIQYLLAHKNLPYELQVKYNTKYHLFKRIDLLFFEEFIFNKLDIEKLYSFKYQHILHSFDKDIFIKYKNWFLDSNLKSILIRDFLNNQLITNVYCIIFDHIFYYLEYDDFIKLSNRFNKPLVFYRKSIKKIDLPLPLLKAIANKIVFCGWCSPEHALMQIAKIKDLEIFY